MENRGYHNGPPANPPEVCTTPALWSQRHLPQRATGRQTGDEVLLSGSEAATGDSSHVLYQSVLTPSSEAKSRHPAPS